MTVKPKGAFGVPHSLGGVVKAAAEAKKKKAAPPKGSFGVTRPAIPAAAVAAEAHKRSVAARKAAVTRKHNAALAAARKGKGKPAAKPVKRGAISPDVVDGLPGWTPAWNMGCNDVFPTCAAAAVANHLLACTGLLMKDEDILALHKLAGGDAGADIATVLECMQSHRSAFGEGSKAYLANFTRTDEDCIVAGLVVGISLPHGGHAVLSHPRGMVSWGRVLPFAGIPQEAWALDWVR